jgi:ParB-like chromosome segregation protein Spo0J
MASDPLKVLHVAVDSLVEDESNTRKHNKRNLAAIKGSLEQFGQVEPLVVQKSTRMVIGGHGRLATLKEMGVKKVAIVEVDVDDEKAKALSVALNRTGDLAGWDEAALSTALSELQTAGFDLSTIGFDEADLAKRFEGMRELSTDGLLEAPVDGTESVDAQGRSASDHVRQVQLFMQTTAFDKFQAQVADLAKHYGTGNVTDTLLHSVNEAHQALKLYEANQA